MLERSFNQSAPVFRFEEEPEKPKIEELEERIRFLEASLRERKEGLRENEELIREEIKKFLEDLQRIQASEQEVVKRDEVKELEGLPGSEQVGALISLVFRERNGLEKAIAIANTLGPAILDEFHDTLIDHFYQKLLEEEILREKLTEELNYLLFLVTIPQFAPKEKEKPLQEFFRLVEEFFSSLAGIKMETSYFRFLKKKLWFVFEIAVPRVGEEIHFYVACPRQYGETIEKQILGFWPEAQIQPTFDYNIFNPKGYAMGSFATLKKSDVIPLKPFNELDIDPLSNFSSVFSKLAKEGEGASIQFVIKPNGAVLKIGGEKVIEAAKQGIKPDKALEKISGKTLFKTLFKEVGQIIFSLITGQTTTEENNPGSQDKKKISPPPSLSPQDQKLVELIGEKISHPLFQVNIRVVASANSRERTEEILNQLENAFEQFNSPILNQLVFKRVKGKDLKRFFYNFSFRIFNPKENIYLSSLELAPLIHFPPPGLLAPKIKWLKTKQAPPPSNLPEEGLLIGKTLYRGESKLVMITDDDRRRHFYIIGQTGTGKSTLLKELIRQDIENNKGVALIDPHGELAESVLEIIPPSRIKDVIYFDPADRERAIGLNMLEYDPLYPEAKTFIVNELLEIFDKLYNLTLHGMGGPVYEQYMRNALLLVMEDPESGNTLIEVPRVLADTAFRKLKLSNCKNLVVKNFWEMEAEKAGGEMALANIVPYITSKMNIFVANDLVRPIIAQEKSAFNFREIMDQEKILIVNLSKGKLGETNSYLLGMIITGRLLLAAFSRADISEKERKDFYLYIDEFHNVTTKTIASALAEARKYRLNLVLAHQYIGQLDEETKKAIFGNVGSMLVFRVGPEDAKYLLTQFEPVFSETDLMNLDNFNGALRLLIRGETSKPFNIVTIPPKKGNPKIAEEVKKYSLTTYGKDRKQIEENLQKRLQKTGFISKPPIPF